MKLDALIFIAVAAIAGGVRGQVVSHLNLVSDKSQDVSTLAAWKAGAVTPGMSDQDKAVAIFNTMTRYRHQASPPREYLQGGPQTGGHVHDPLKTIHVYGYGQCCCVSAQVSGLARYIGMEARGRDITAHSVSEVFYDNAWHLIDCSVMNYHLRPDGKIASVDDINKAVTEWIKTRPELLNDKGAPDDKKLRVFAKNEGWKKGPALLARSDAFYGKNGVNTAGWHGWPSTMQEYFKVMGEQEFGPVMGYQLNVQLRPGEKITRNFFSRGIEYTNSMNESYYQALLGRKSLGLQTRLGDAAPGRVGDGTIEWDVPMDGLDKVALANDGSSFVLRFPSSYVYVKGRAVVKTSGPVTVSLSDTNGLAWEEIAHIPSAGEQTIDLTPHVKRRYDYRLRFDPQNGAKVQGIRTTHDFQCSQAALPVITEGHNQLTFTAGPQEGTVTIEGSTNLDEARKHGQVTVADFKPELEGMNQKLAMTAGRGSATFDVATPGEMSRIRVSVVWRARDKGDGFEIQYSTDGGKTFKAAPAGKLHGGTKGSSRYCIIEGLPAGTKSAKVRFAGTQKNTAVIFDLRIDADYKEPAGVFRPVKIAYAWDENGRTKTFEHVARTEKDDFTITCGQGAVVKSFSMELAE